MKALRYVLGGLAAVATLGAAVLAYLALTFEASDYAPRIVRYVQEQTGRTLHFDGPISLGVWPDIGVDLGRAWLSERDSDEHFVDVESAHITAKLLPLFSRELVAREIRVQGASIAIVRFSDGRLNVDDLLQREGETLQFDIGRIAVERSRVVYRDIATGKGYELADLDVEAGRISNTANAALKAKLTARNASRSFEVITGISGRLALDLPQQRYGLGDAVLELTGHVPGVQNFTAKLRGDFDADLKGRRFDAVRVAASANGVFRGEAIDLDVGAVKISASAGHAQAATVDIDMRAAGTAGKTRVKLAVPQIDRDEDVVKTPAAAVEVLLDRSGLRIAAAASTPLEASLAARSVTLARLQSNFHATGARLPRGGIKGTVGGSANIDLARQGTQVELDGKVDQSRIRARASSRGFASPVYTFAVDIDELDVARYAAAEETSQPSTQPVRDLSGLENLPANGTVRIGVLRSGGVTARNVKLALQ